MPQDLVRTYTYHSVKQQRCQSVIQQYSHHKLHTAHTEASFPHFAAFLFVCAEFSTKPRKFTCSCLSRVCYKHALNLTRPDSAPVPATAILCIAQYWYMPELIKLWKETQRKKQTSKLWYTELLHCIPSPCEPQIHLSMQLPCPDALPFNPTHRKIWRFGLCQGNSDRTAQGGMEAQGESASPHHTPSVYCF